MESSNLHQHFHLPQSLLLGFQVNLLLLAPMYRLDQCHLQQYYVVLRKLLFQISLFQLQPLKARTDSNCLFVQVILLHLNPKHKEYPHCSMLKSVRNHKKLV